MCNKLYEVIYKEKEDSESCSKDIEKLKKIPIRELTRQLRREKMFFSINWMKENLPCGVTGEWLIYQTVITLYPDLNKIV
jgi:hypothetical protein